MKILGKLALVFMLLISTASLCCADSFSLVLPSGLTCISVSAFENASAIDEVVIGSNVKRIESRAFAGSSVKLVVFPDDSALEYIAPDAFDGTVGVQFITGGSSVALSYIGTAGITVYAPAAIPSDEQNYQQTIFLPIIPF